ncbi:MAG: hypothetical protein JXR81_04440 [Candidatus Goldbacteria bacterium]|nr:hypothetical protein [Candidatus Goldiibacteriota bacterium]
MIEWIQTWYATRINKDIKCENVSIHTLDNPGWILEYDLNHNEFLNLKVEPLKFELTEENWYSVLIDNGIWMGAGGAGNLIDILIKFKEFLKDEQKIFDKDLVEWLQKWYENECNGDWEHSYGVSIKTLTDKFGWGIKIELIETKYENKKFNSLDIYRSECDWLKCRISDNVWYADCGVKNLVESLEVFRSFIYSNQ